MDKFTRLRLDNHNPKDRIACEHPLSEREGISRVDSSERCKLCGMKWSDLSPEEWGRQAAKDAIKKAEANKDRIAPAREFLLADNEALRLQVEKYEKALTPSTETKVELMGEFAFSVETTEGFINVEVPWTVIKDIMLTISERATRVSAPSCPLIN